MIGRTLALYFARRFTVMVLGIFFFFFCLIAATTYLEFFMRSVKDAEFDARKVDQFVDDIRAWSPGITRSRFNALMRETLATVKRYKQFYEEHNPEGSFTPFTVIRHCLYLGDKQLFRRALRNSSREAFEAWLQGAPYV